MYGDDIMSTSSSPRAMPRQGIALPIALGAIVVAGALIAGVFFAATQEFRIGRNSLATQRAAHAAEAGLSSVVSGWQPTWTTATKVGVTRKLADTTIDGASVRRQITKVGATVFWVDRKS